MSATAVDQSTSKLKPAVLQQILGKLNDLKTGPAIDKKQLPSKLAILRNDHQTLIDMQKLSRWEYNSQTEAGKATYLSAHPEVAKFLNQKILGFDILDEMWRNTQTTGYYGATVIPCHFLRDIIIYETTSRSTLFIRCG